MKSIWIKMVLLAFSVLASSALVFAQGSATGDLHVMVKDPSGKVVTNAMVTVIDQARGVTRVTALNSDGEYRIVALAPGRYTVSVTAAGFSKAVYEDQAITVGQVADLPVTLQVSGGETVVSVSSEASLIETSQTSSTDTIEQRRIDNLPINGRNYIQFTLTDSQVVRDNAPNVGAAPTSGLNMSGQRARSNLVNVDGADATDNSVNGVRSTVSQEAVQEFQIISNNYAAEYGRAAGGVVNIITRSGSNEFHGDVFGYLRNRNFQAVNPFSTVSNPAYTRVQAGAAFGGPIKKDKTYYYFSYEVTRRHETGFSSIGQNNFGLVPFDASPFFGAPAGTFGIQVTPDQAAFLSTPGVPLQLAQQYAIVTGGSSAVALTGHYPAAFALLVGAPGGLPIPLNGSNPLAQFVTTCNSQVPLCNGLPATFTSSVLNLQRGNFPVFEGTSLYSLRLDHNITTSNRLMLRANVSPSTVTGIEPGGQDQPFGQNAYSRTSQQTYRDVAGTVQDSWSIGSNKVNEFRFQYSRRGLSYFYNTAIPSGSDPAVNITGVAYFGREPYSYIQRTEQRYQATDNFSWAIGRHDTKFGADFNYLPLSAIFTVNYGGVYDFGGFSLTPFGFPSSVPGLSAVQSYGAGLPAQFVQGFGSPSDSFTNKPFGVFWQDSWRVSSKVTLNYGVRYDVEFPPQFKAPTGLAAGGYNFLGLQKGIQTDANNVQPRLGVAWDPKGDGKTVVRASYGMFYDHPLLGLYFLGDASDGSTSGQLAFGPGLCSGPGQPGNVNAVSTFQGLPINVPSPLNPCAASINPAVTTALGFRPNQQQFQALNFPQSIFLNQNYLNPASFMPLAFQPFGYPQAKNFVYAYSQQANLTVERDLGSGFALSLAYNYNGGRHLNRPINANTIRGDLMLRNFAAASAFATANGLPTPASPFTVSACGVGPGGPFVPAALTNFFRPSGVNPSIGLALLSNPLTAPCVAQVLPLVQQAYGLNTNCDLTTLSGCVPFGDMDANYSNGSSVYHGFTSNLRKRFGSHYQFQASYTWSHAIDDSTDLQSTLTPQDSYFPMLDRSNSTFDQRHRFVFSGVYQTGKVGNGGFASKLASNWTFAPIIDVASGRPFNIVTGNEDNMQLESLTGRPNTFVNPACGSAYPAVPSKFSPTGVFQEPCPADFNGTLLSLDGNLSRNAGVTPWTLFNDIRVARRVYFGERVNMDLMADIFNIANRYNVSAVSPLFTNAGQATAAYDPRQFQFALKLNW